MKNRKLRLILVLLVIVVIIAAVVAAFYVRPIVILENRTNQPVHVITSQSTVGQSTPQESSARQEEEITLAPGESIRLPLRVTSLLSGDTTFQDNSWRVGEDPNGKRFTQGFVTDRHKGYCSARVTINEHGFMLLEEDSQIYCYKKWVPLWPEKN